MRFQVCILATIVLSTVLHASAAEQDLSNRRLKRAAAYLRGSAIALHGENQGGRLDFTPTADNLWKQVRQQYEVVFGTQTANEHFKSHATSVKDLEDKTFDILEALWGHDWPQTVEPLVLPMRSKAEPRHPKQP